MNGEQRMKYLHTSQDVMPLVGYDARLYHRTFTINKQALTNMQYIFDDVIYRFRSNDELNIGDIVQVIGHQNNILIVKKIN